MADSFTLELDATALSQAITAMPAALQKRVLEACKTTADRIVRDGQARLRRQLSSSATGQTVAGIHAQLAYDGNGYVVISDNPRMLNLPLWLEKGTKPGQRRNFARTAPRPYYYTSIEAEAGAHERRIVDAMEQSASDVGLGQ